MLTTKYSQWQTVTFYCMYVTQHTLFQDLHYQEQCSALRWAPHHHESILPRALVHQIHDKSGLQCVHQLLPHAAEDLWSLEPELKENLILEYYKHIQHIKHVMLIQNPLMCLKIPYIGCPTPYRTQHFFNNSNTNEDIATKFEQEYVCCVRNEKECVCSVCL